MVFVLIKMSKNIRMLIRSWKSGSQVWKCCDQEDEEADWIKKIFATPWMGRSRRKKDQLLYIPQGHPPGGRPHGRRGPHWYGLPPYWTSAIPGHPEAFSIAFPTFPPALCSPWQASPWSGGHLWSYCYWVVGGLLSPKLFQLQKSSQSQKEKWDLIAWGNMDSLSSQLFALLAVPIHLNFPLSLLFFSCWLNTTKCSCFIAQGYMLEALSEISPSGLKAHISRFSH